MLIIAITKMGLLFIAIILIVIIISLIILYISRDKIIDKIRNVEWQDIINEIQPPQDDVQTSYSYQDENTIHYESDVLTSEPINSIEERQYFRSQPENRNKYFMEEQCRMIFEGLFPGHKFIKVRPKWLKNPLTGKLLELDGYNEKLKLAFEYNGYQHYIYPNKYHKTRDEFIAQKQRDIIKIELCDKQGVFLMTIPYDVPLHHLRSFIERHIPQR